ncbi:2-amino-4-hydroxy-6-hydroxymethyldihydropteridine diphosphokinase [Prevotella sp. oral taxon 376]|uniref:2-amino-4-hydroxy-6- hydroxymethyldihydropteridine diphosphokinase n=1 Tax=Prevotella sp. oral taxon 376 TaxID=712466 RepID=UPI000D1DDDBF|nr:2-amino-4-hydroxy-6-hydroxymethyldihydropteridine diphosphokinase [Prevotella sp. oral taxon 376]PTL33095.1 2-amino-4-hydroxy-6-hydroxymethyldihydropteridine diphosphokinase [Prevotella sp. oral taxon 376]
MTKSHTVYFSLGSNLGDRRKTMDDALRLLDTRVGPLERVSSFYETDPWGFSSPHKFLNACACCTTPDSPQQVLEATQEIERHLGRSLKTSDGQYHDRPIDIDILLYDDLTVDKPGLRIPHPLMREREFVMRPLHEILTGGDR